ncbi:MAG: hypothetical protein D8M57_04815 [Candidatus Scalindua sp. AMX11]|nr:MAG: hypothetical protein DWQ00_03780 [Candidatus Scalindua sp.]TDE66136.1 MAG: hypothetical protein D8M57_04815 [Candidatus Scalindua sp. AMX11]
MVKYSLKDFFIMSDPSEWLIGRADKHQMINSKSQTNSNEEIQNAKKADSGHSPARMNRSGGDIVI